MIKIHSSRILLIAVVGFISACSKQTSPEDFLIFARNAFLDLDRVDYTALAMYPTPIGEIDTTVFNVSFERSEKSSIGYDYMIKWRDDYRKKDLVYINEEYRVVDHLGELVKFFPEEDSLKEANDIRYSLPVSNSPIGFLRETDWEFEGDTVIKGREAKNYVRIENDKVNKNEDTILTEQHIFINTSTKLLERFERRNYFNGNLSQVVAYEFSDYTTLSGPGKLAYNYPLDYQSAPMGVSPYKNLLAVGQKAPDFITRDEQNNLIRLSDYRGKNVLLDFSIINCGYCLESLKHFNRKDYQISGTIVPIYINPLDKQNDIKSFNNEFKIPFPIAYSNAGEIANLYGVFSYPLFYLINEDGIIEKVIIGYDSEFQESLKS